MFYVVLDDKIPLLKIDSFKFTTLVTMDLNYGIKAVMHFRKIARPGGEAYDAYGNCQIHSVVISSTDPIYDVLCRSFLNFTATCYSSDSELIRFVIKHDMFCARAQSPIGRNYALCCTRYGSKVEDELKSGIKSSCCNNEALMRMSVTDYRHVSFALELIMLRAGILYTSDCEWSRAQIDCMLTVIGTR